MEGPSGDREQSAVDLPTPGWYTDPSGDGGIRWWTGHEWAQRVGGVVTDAPGVAESKPQLSSGSLLIAQSISAAKAVASQLFALIAIFIIPAFMAFAGAVWYALQEAAFLVSVDPETGAFTLIESRGTQQISGRTGLIFLTLGLIWLGGAILSMASSSQILQSHASRPATWVQSLAALAARPVKTTISLTAFIVFSAVMSYIWFSGEVIAILLIIPSIFVAMVVWTLYSFVATAVAVGAEKPSVFRQSSSAASNRFFAVFVRNLFFSSWTVLTSIGFFFVTRLITSGAAEDPSLPGISDKFLLTFTGPFGNNVYLWFLVSLLSALFWGAIVCIWSGAVALLYAELDGDVTIKQHPLIDRDET